MDLPTHERGPPGLNIQTNAQPLNVTLLGNMFALTRNTRFLYLLHILAEAGNREAQRELSQFSLKDATHASDQTTISEG